VPELPEVETVRRDLCRSVCGRVVTGVEVRCPAMLVHTTPEALGQALCGARLGEIARIGKVLIFRFEGGHSLLVHFRMTGQMYPAKEGEDLPDHTRTVLTLDDRRRLVHADVRRLGTLELVRTAAEQDSATLARIGPDALDAPPGLEELRARLKRRKSAIKGLLLDQRVMSGVGNIYACEILARARIAPQTPCDRLSRVQVEAILAATRAVLLEAVEARGTTISDYRTGTGDPGGFQHQLRVYGREGMPCLVAGCEGVVQRLVQGQRSTYLCPCCQAARRRPESRDT